MSSIELTPQNVAMINRLVLEVRQFGSARDIPRERAAADMAGQRLLEKVLTEAELRAIIYDSVFSNVIDEMNTRYFSNTKLS